MGTENMEIYSFIKDLLTKVLNCDVAMPIGVVIAMIVVAVNIFNVLYSSSIEELFMSSKKKTINSILRLATISSVVALINYFSVIYTHIIVLETLGLILLILYCIYCFCRKGKYYSDDKLANYYEERVCGCALLIVLQIAPAIIYLYSENIHKNSDRINIVLLGSAIECIVICLLIPEIIKNKSRHYIEYKNKKIYIYEKINKETFLCGETPYIYDSKVHILLDLKTIKENEIFYEKYRKLKREKIRKLNVRKIKRKAIQKNNINMKKGSGS